MNIYAFCLWLRNKVLKSPFISGETNRVDSALLPFLPPPHHIISGYSRSSSDAKLCSPVVYRQALHLGNIVKSESRRACSQAIVNPTTRTRLSKTITNSPASSLFVCTEPHDLPKTKPCKYIPPRLKTSHHSSVFTHCLNVIVVPTATRISLTAEARKGGLFKCVLAGLYFRAVL